MTPRMMHRSLGSFLFVAALLLASITMPGTNASAGWATVAFAWQGDANYRAEGTLIYDLDLSMIAIGLENNFEPLPGIEELSIRFFDPLDSLVFQTTMIQDGVNRYNWLRMQFDTVALEFTGFFDLGSDSNLGDHYLAGTIGGPVWLQRNFPEAILDQNVANGTLTVTRLQAPIVPAPSAFLAGLTCLLLLAFGPRKFQRSPIA